MKKIILEFTGHRGMGGEKIFKSDDGVYFMEDNRDIFYIGKDIDNDPLGSVSNIEKYKDTKFILQGHEDEPTEAERFNYIMLGRLQSDCNYYLGNGNRNKTRLWAGDEVEQIEEMKKIYNSFSDDKKPEWLTLDQILEYEKEMVK